MNFNDYFFPLFQKVQNIDPAVILNKIRQHGDQEFFVLADQFNLSWLRDCINEPNCRVVFYSGDSIAASSRIKFLTDTLDAEKRKNIIFVSSNFSKVDVRSFLGKGATIQLWKQNNNAIGHEVSSLARTFPNQIRLVAKGFLGFWITRYIRNSLQMQFFFKKDDFPYPELKIFAINGGQRVCIVADAFTPEELSELSTAGAFIWQRPEGEAPIA